MPTEGGRLETARNLIINSLRSSRLPVMVTKALRRLARRNDNAERAEAGRWCEQRAEDDAAFARSLDPLLWTEAVDFAVQLQESARAKLLNVRYHLGGGGHYALLYFLVRHLRPQVVVETGVAAGWSSEAILSALAANGQGTLHSSDFPIMRLAHPETYIGILVRPEHRTRWELHTDGDARNLPRILARLRDSSIDLVHYDSDKTERGRSEALRTLSVGFRRGTIIVMDDIHDNLFFARFAEGRRSHVFRFEQKFLGLVEWE